MHRDVKNGLFLGLLLVGVVGALFFRRDTDHHELVLPDIQDVHEIDAAIADKPLIPYITGGTNAGSDVTVNKPTQRQRNPAGNVTANGVSRGSANGRDNSGDNAGQVVVAKVSPAKTHPNDEEHETDADNIGDVENVPAKSTSDSRLAIAKSNDSPAALPPAAATVADDGVVSRSRRNTATPRHNDSWTVPAATGSRTPAPIALGGSLTSTVDRPVSSGGVQSETVQPAKVHAVAQSQQKASTRDAGQQRVSSANFDNNLRPSKSGTADPELDDDAPAGMTYTTQPGDTLSSVAARFLGSSGRYNDLFLANRDLLNDPNVLPEGVTLRIPIRSAATGNPAASPRKQRPADLAPDTDSQNDPISERGTSVPRDGSTGANGSLGANGSMFAPAGRSPLKTLRRLPGQRSNGTGVEPTTTRTAPSTTGKRSAKPIDSVPAPARPQTSDPGLPAIDTQVLESELGLDD